MKRVYLGVLIFLASGCSSTPANRAAVKAPESHSTFILASNRHLETKPCGCKETDLGGVEREAALASQTTQQRGSAPFLVTSGTSFLPTDSDFGMNKIDEYRASAESVIDALNSLGTFALSPTIDDAYLGLATLGRLANRAKFPFVSANLVDAKTKQPLFATFIDVSRGLTGFLVIGVSHTGGSAFPTTDEVLALEPVEAVGRAIQEAGVAPHYPVVLLSSLREAEMNAVLKRYPQVRLVLGGEPSRSGVQRVMARPDVYVANTMDRGRSVVRASINNAGGFAFDAAPEILLLSAPPPTP